jgi:hypothetical protein
MRSPIRDSGCLCSSNHVSGWPQVGFKWILHSIPGASLALRVLQLSTGTAARRQRIPSFCFDCRRGMLWLRSTSSSQRAVQPCVNVANRFLPCVCCGNGVDPSGRVLLLTHHCGCWRALIPCPSPTARCLCLWAESQEESGMVKIVLSAATAPSGSSAPCAAGAKMEAFDGGDA